MNTNDIHTCGPYCDRPACIRAQRDELRDQMERRIVEAVAAEREECAKVADAYEPRCDVCPRGVAAAIRARK